MTQEELQKHLDGLTIQRDNAREIYLRCEGAIGILQFLLTQPTINGLPIVNDGKAAPRSLPAGSELTQLEAATSKAGQQVGEIKWEDHES